MHNLSQSLRVRMRSSNPSGYFLIMMLLIQAVSQCCSDGCSQATYCLCNATASLDVCISMVNSTASNFTISDEPTYFYYSPTEQNYDLIKLIFCGTAIDGVNNSLLVTIETQPGDYPMPENSNSATFATTPTCQTLYILDAKFTTMANGQRQNLLLMLNLTGPGSENMTIWVEAQEKVAGYLIPILASCIGALVLVLVIILAIYLKRRHDAKKAVNLANDLSHLDNFMPVKRLEQISSVPSINCAICLVDVMANDNTRNAPCGHYFHELCINDWCKKNMKCPVCREDFTQQALSDRLRRSVQPRETNWHTNELQNVLVDDNARL